MIGTSRWVLVTVSSLLLAAAGCQTASEVDVEAARQALDASEPQRAVEALAGAGDADTLGALAEAQLAAGAYDDALETAESAADSAAGSRALALVHAARFESEPALAALEAGLSANPGDAGVLAAKGRVLWQLKQTSSAIQALEQATNATDPRVRAEAEYWLGRIYLFRGWQSEGAFPGWHEETEVRAPALDSFKAAAEARPAWYAPHVGLGTALLADGDAAAALTSFDQAIERAPNLASAHVGRWRALDALDRTAEIETEVADAAGSADVRLLDAARQGYALLGNTAEADALAARIVDQFGDSPAAATIEAARIAEASEADDHAAVIEQASAFAERHPYSARLTDVYDALFSAYAATPSAPVEEVAAAVENNIAHRPDAGGYFAGAALLQSRNASVPRSIELAEAGLAATERFIDENLPSYKMEGKSSSALERSRAQAADLIGWGYFLQSDLESAERRLVEAERLTHGLDPTVQFHLGELRREQGNLDQAREHYLTALTVERVPEPVRVAATASLEEVHVELGNEPGEFEGYMTRELERRDRERRAAMLQTLVGQPAPELRLTSTTGEPFDLQAEQGKIVMLGFFASWCGACRAEMPQIQEAQRQYADDPNVEFVLVSVDDDPERLARYMEERQFAFPVLQGDREMAAETFSVDNVPAAFYIDPQGTVRYEARGGSPFGESVDRVSWFIEELKRNPVAQP